MEAVISRVSILLIFCFWFEYLITTNHLGNWPCCELCYSASCWIYSLAIFFYWFALVLALESRPPLLWAKLQDYWRYDEPPKLSPPLADAWFACQTVDNHDDYEELNQLHESFLVNMKVRKRWHKYQCYLERFLVSKRPTLTRFKESSLYRPIDTYSCYGPGRYDVSHSYSIFNFD